MTNYQAAIATMTTSQLLRLRSENSAYVEKMMPRLTVRSDYYSFVEAGQCDFELVRKYCQSLTDIDMELWGRA